MGNIGDQAKRLDDLIATKDYIKLTINGHEFTERFQLTNFTIGEGDWLNVTEGTISLESFREGINPSELASEEENYEGWEGLAGSAQFIEEFSDDFSFERSANSTSYTHSVKIKYAAINPENGQHITPPLTAGLTLAQTLVDNETRPAFLWLVEEDLQGLYYNTKTPNCKRLFTESVDEINNTVSVTESFNAENIKTDTGGSDPYSFSAKQTIDISEDGIITVGERGTVINLLLDTDDNTRAGPGAALLIELVNAIKPEGRLQAIFEAHKQGWMEEKECIDKIEELVTVKEGDDAGNLVLIERGIVTDLFRGQATYSIKGTNDQKIADFAKHEYTTTIEAEQYDTSDACLPWIKARQQGTFTGHDPAGVNLAIQAGQKIKPRFDNAVVAWQQEKDDIKTNLKHCTGGNPFAYQVVMNNTYSPEKGQLAYDIQYSSEPKYGTTDLACPYKQWTYSYSDDFTADSSNCVFQHTLQNVPNHENKIQVLQKRNTTALPNSTASHKLVGKRNAKIGDLAFEIQDNALTNVPRFDGGPKTLKDCSYTYNPENDIIFEASFSWE
jgi:hypothetical protein